MNICHIPLTFRIFGDHLVFSRNPASIHIVCSQAAGLISECGKPSLPKSPAVLGERDWAAPSKLLDQNPTQTPWVHSSTDYKDNRQTQTATILENIHHNTCFYQHGKETDWDKQLTSPQVSLQSTSGWAHSHHICFGPPLGHLSLLTEGCT